MMRLQGTLWQELMPAQQYDNSSVSLAGFQSAHNTRLILVNNAFHSSRNSPERLIFLESLKDDERLVFGQEEMGHRWMRMDQDEANRGGEVNTCAVNVNLR